ncbi:MAG: hypothetical protein M1327_04185 [Candidatus Thermoplasmatota archaeon]|nr:hypothetical protein [Candidatus Thermoplasmatota archaeon]
MLYRMDEKSPVQKSHADIGTIQPYLLSFLSGSVIALSYVFLPLRIISAGNIDYDAMGITIFVFLLFFLICRVPSVLMAASEYRNFASPTAFILLSASMYELYTATVLEQYLLCGIALGAAMSFSVVAISVKLSESYSSSKISFRKSLALLLGAVSFPLTLGFEVLTNIPYLSLMFYLVLILLVIGGIFLAQAFIGFYRKNARPRRDDMFVIISKTFAPLRMLSNISMKGYFLSTLLIDTLFVFSAWSVIIYLPYYSYELLNSISSLLVTFTIVSLFYLGMRYAGQRLKSDGFRFASYFFRPVAFIVAFFMLSLANSFNLILYALLVLASVGIFEEGTKQFVEFSFNKDDRVIVRRASQLLRAPFVVLAPLFSYEFFSISTSLGFASAIIPAAISLLVSTFVVSNNPSRVFTPG